ncbi:hypothetical protein [Saccharopolyspora erythraea]|uniref:hypothetical protein n=1 Tax=Saccharopolyspora erythraea TaxID=1836 RepID=UPI0020138593|nr:hypothetical protein [Saccharopolyspora erythraea]
MQELPRCLGAEKVLRGMEEFGIRATTTTYVPVGFGDYHWKAGDGGGRLWFVTVSDLEHKEHCGRGAAAALEGLRRAMGTAVSLHEDGLDFVVAPLRSAGGDPVVALDDRYAMSVFPLVTGESGEFGQELTAAQRNQVLDWHPCTPAHHRNARRRPCLTRRAVPGWKPHSASSPSRGRAGLSPSPPGNW